MVEDEMEVTDLVERRIQTDSGWGNKDNRAAHKEVIRLILF